MSTAIPDPSARHSATGNSTAPLTAPLGAFGRQDVAVAGGKGANLGELVRAGFPVPPGFVITTAAYARFIAAGGLRPVIERALSALDVADRDALAQASRTIQQAFAEAAVPEDVASAVRAAYGDLCREQDTDRSAHTSTSESAPVAVRSSATAEDLPGAAFAGQQETYLNVIGEDAVLRAVQQCWASLWSDRAIAYRHRQGMSNAEVQLAVVVQRLVDAEVAGVLFTANPVTGARDELLLDASPGLGEAVVSGHVTPDHYRLRKGSHEILELSLGQREVVIRPAAGGGTEHLTANGNSAVSTPALPEEAIRQLAAMAEAVERHFGTPQDIEWAWENGRCLVLQSRPITALPPAPGEAAPQVGSPLPQRADKGVAPVDPIIAGIDKPAPSRARRRGRGPNFAGELFAVRPYPLDATGHLKAMLSAVGDAMAGPIGIHFPTADEIVVMGEGVPIRLAAFEPRPTLRALYKPWLSIWQRRHFDLRTWARDPLLAQALARAQALEARDLASLSWREVVGTLHEALSLYRAFAALRERYFPLAIWDTVRLALLLRLAGQHRRFVDLMAGVETKTMQLNQALARLAEMVRSSPTLTRIFAETAPSQLPSTLGVPAWPHAPSAGADELLADVQAFRAAFLDFLREYGHRESTVTVTSLPTWKEAPETPLSIVRSLAVGASGNRAEETVGEPMAGSMERASASGEQVWQRARDAVLSDSFLGRPPLRGWFLHLLESARVFAQLREDTHFYLTVPMPLERRSILELGRRLVDVSVLDTPDDVFHLTLAELEAAGDPWPPPELAVRRLRETVTRRKAQRAALADTPFVGAGVDDAPPPVSEGALLSGTPGAAGVVEGKVRVIHGPADFGTLQAGEVLVAPFTNPSWTPLFQVAAGVVVDTGAAMSHAAIVAREYGIPAVMGARNATRVLRTGQRVRIDGSRGLVFTAD